MTDPASWETARRVLGAHANRAERTGSGAQAYAMFAARGWVREALRGIASGIADEAGGGAAQPQPGLS